jgi:endoglucanase
MNLDLQLLKKICTAYGAPGYEQDIRALVIEEVTPWVDELKVDNLGNILTLKKGENNPDGKKAMVAAHLDEIGFIVTHIDDDGFLRFHTLGGFDPKTLTAQRVIVHGKEDLIGVMGCKPIHVMDPDERTKMPKNKDFFIDLGLEVEAVKELVQVGNPITREREFIEMGNCVNCKSIDNRVSVFILVEALKELKHQPYDVHAVFSVQEEVGLRGAQVAAQQINPDFGFGLDTTIAYDLPGAAAHEKVTALGKGTAIKIMDASAISDYRMVSYLKELAVEHEIPWQPEILTAGGTDTASIQKMGKHGAISGAISVPTRYLHQVIEMAHKKDIMSSIQLLTQALTSLDKYNWDHQ